MSVTGKHHFPQALADNPVAMEASPQHAVSNAIELEGDFSRHWRG